MSGCFFASVFSQGTPKAPPRVWRPRRWAASDRMTRWGHVWEKKGQEGICGSGLEIQTQETCWKEDTHSCLTGLAILQSLHKVF